MNKTKQSTSGDNSPATNIEGDVHGDVNIITAIKGESPSNELQTMLALVQKLSQEASTEDLPKNDSYLKALSEKLEKYKEPGDSIKADYTELRTLYEKVYDEVLESLQIDELSMKKMANKLAFDSNQLLEEHSFDASDAFKLLIEAQESKVAETVKDFDSGAIRYVLYRQFIECNVFSIEKVEA